MASSNTAMTFNIYQGESLVRKETLHQDIIKVGKLASSHLRIEDEGVSRMHAVIEVSGPDEIFVIDLGSASGTLVNGKKINKAKLESGDELTFGTSRVVVEMGAADAESALPEPVATHAATASTTHPVTTSAPANPFAVGGGLVNPFAAPAAPLAAVERSDSDLAPEAYRWGIVSSGPPVHPSDVEDAATAAELMVMWGESSVLHVAHMSPPRSFYVGEPSAAAAVDYLVGSELLGADRLPVVVAIDGHIGVVLHPGAEGEVIAGEQTQTFAELEAAGKLQPCTEFAGAQQYVLPAQATARVRYKGFLFVTKATSVGKKIGVGAEGVNWGQQVWTMVSLGVHAVFLLMFFFLPPSSRTLSLDLLHDGNRLVDYLVEPPASVEEETPQWLDEVGATDTSSTGERHRDDEGAMGEESSERTNDRFGIEGPADNPDPHMAREAAMEAARNAGAIGALASLSGAWMSPTSPYGADTALGSDPMSALGALTGDNIGSNFGFGGLGLRGTGRGGGGTGEGTIGQGNLGTISHGAGVGATCDPCVGATAFSNRGSHVPRIHSSVADVHGSLSAEVIRRVVRRHINEVRFCYEQELTTRPDLSGRVTVSFIIAATGAVQTASVASSTLSNSRVEQCMVTAVRRWTFPAPDGGVVGVNYPFVLDSGD